MDILEPGYLETVSPRGLVRLTSFQRGLSEGDLPGLSVFSLNELWRLAKIREGGKYVQMGK